MRGTMVCAVMLVLTCSACADRKAAPADARKAPAENTPAPPPDQTPQLDQKNVDRPQYMGPTASPSGGPSDRPRSLEEMRSELESRLSAVQGRTRAPMLASTKSLTDRLTDDQIEKVVLANIDTLAPCVKSDSLVTIHALVTPEGKVLDPSSDASIPDEAQMRDCVVKAFRSVTFPSVTGTRASPITFDLMLKPRVN